MKLSVSIAITLAATLTSTTAFADAMILSATQQDFVISYDWPTGTAADKLAMGTDTLGYRSVPTKPGKPLAITISADGVVVARGTVNDNRSYVVMPSGKGYRLVTAGLVAQTESYPFAAIGVVNALPESYTVDLVGDSSQTTLKNVKIATAFETASTTKVPASVDNRYRAMIHLPDGTTVKGLSAVDAGTYVVIHKNYQGVVTASAAGYIDVPPPPKPLPKKH